MNPIRSTRTRVLTGALAAALTCAGMTAAAVTTAPVAVADTAPAPGVPATPSADSLPTTQIDGVAWQQAIAGDLVYAGGEFTTARPAGAPSGSSTVPRANLLRYDIRTGVLDAGWNPGANGSVRAVVASPDGRRVYVGGSFTNVAGVNKYRIAAFDTATGQLVSSFVAGTNSQVRAIAATDTTVYVGGIFTQAGGQARTKLAAFNAANGALLPWDPVVDDGSVSALTVSPDGSSVVVGGNFTSFNGSPANGVGLARVDAVTGESEPLPVNSVVRNSGTNGSILGLTSDDTSFYGVGYTWGRTGGTLEGTFRASWETGELTWILDCHGDSYAVHAAEDVVYSASHYHYCGNVRSLPQETPWQYFRANAMTKDATQLVGREHLGYTNFEGRPGPTHLTWFPDMDTGTYTGQNQGPWAVTGNDEYVVWGGEFLNVNFRRQQGLARFAVRELAPNEVGPSFSGADFTPTARGAGSGAVRLAWQANVDFDNEVLTYTVTRDGGAPVWTGTASSFRWHRPWLGFTDTGLTPGSTHSYRVTATDPFGNAVTSPAVSATVPGSGALSAYARTVMADGASHYWRLDDASGTARDSASVNDASVGGAVTRGVPGAIVGDSSTAFRLADSTDSRIVAPAAFESPSTVTVEAWISTTSNRGGRIVGFSQSASPTGTSTNRDRHLYMDNAGRVLFGVSPGQNRAIASQAGLNDGRWHHVVGTLGPDGIALYVDGTRVAQRTDWRTARNLRGYWRIGGDNLAGWLNQPSTNNFTGSVDEVAVYPVVLTPERIAEHHRLGTTGTVPNAAPTASFTAAATDLAVAVDGRASTDPDGSVASYAWDFGDGATATGATAAHSYAAPGTYTITLTVTDEDGATGTATRVVAVTTPPVNQAPVARIVATATGLAVTVDGSGSSDADGSVIAYAWSFGDGGTASGAVAGHAYAVAGEYTVSLTVTDDDGATATATQVVTVTQPPAGVVYALDSFSRSVADGWGTAEQGGPWTHTSAGTYYSVAGGQGRITVPRPGWALGERLAEVASTDTDLRAIVGLDKMPTGGGTDADVVVRSVDASSGYRFRLKLLATGVVRASLIAVSGGTTTLAQVNVPGLTYAAGDRLAVRVQAEGTAPTQLRAKVWPAGATEPADWLLTASSAATGLQAPGGVGFVAYVSGSATNTPQTLVVDDVRATSTTEPAPGGEEPPANQPPVAALTTTVDGLSVAVDGRGSTDADGTVVAYAWELGDGATATGPTATHSYATPGTYTVRLTVTDDDGATASTSGEVTVAAPGGGEDPGTPDPLARDAFARTVTGGWGTADVGGDWSVVGRAGDLSVADGVGAITIANPGWSASAYLRGVQSAATDLQATVALDRMPTGAGTDVGLVGRAVGTSDGYRLRLKLLPTGVVRASLLAVDGSTATLAQLNVPGLTYAAGDQLRVRLQVTGTSPTTIVGKVWRAGTEEPAGWTLTATDSTAALQVPGGIGVTTYASTTSTNTPQTLAVRDLVAVAPTP